MIIRIPFADFKAIKNGGQTRQTESVHRISELPRQFFF